MEKFYGDRVNFWELLESTLTLKNFSGYRNPTPESSAELDNVIWEPFTEQNPKYLNINETSKMENGIYFSERLAFWKKLFPLTG